MVRLLLGNCYAVTETGESGERRVGSMSLSHNPYHPEEEDGDLDQVDVASTVPSVRDLLANSKVKLSVFSKAVSGKKSQSSGSNVPKLAKLSSDILDGIVREHSAVISTVLAALMERLQAPPSGLLLREQVDAASLLQLPCPKVLYR
jgi:hypothetical protein